MGTRLLGTAPAPTLFAAPAALASVFTQVWDAPTLPTKDIADGAVNSKGGAILEAAIPAVARVGTMEGRGPTIEPATANAASAGVSGGTMVWLHHVARHDRRRSAGRWRDPFIHDYFAMKPSPAG